MTNCIDGEENQYGTPGVFECLACAEGCESCEDDRPCVVSLNWVMRTAILILSCVVICCLPIVVLFTWKYGNVKTFLENLPGHADFVLSYWDANARPQAVNSRNIASSLQQLCFMHRQQFITMYDCLHVETANFSDVDHWTTLLAEERVSPINN
ncbi:uncharacterized protein CBL_14054 [Carabus blaptoides fortunei]